MPCQASPQQHLSGYRERANQRGVSSKHITRNGARHCLALSVVAVACSACSGATTRAGSVKKSPLPPVAPLQSPDAPSPKSDAPPLLIQGGTVMTAAGDIYAPGHVLVRAGRIQAVGPGPGPQAGAETRVIDASGMYITPGLIDTHSHMGVYSLPFTRAHYDGNEMSSPNTANVDAEDAFWPQDPSLSRALAGGVTTIQVLPGSANLIGGRTFTAKLWPRTHARAMRFPGAPEGLKMACGENPKRVYGGKGRFPMTRMGNVAGYRKAFQEAREYARDWKTYERDLEAWQGKAEAAAARGETFDEDPPEPPARDFAKDTLARVLAGDILVHVHCYRADEMHRLLDLASTFGFEIRSFHHALEAYKLRHRLAEQEVSISTWADWWGFKMEAYDGVPYNAAMVHAAGGRTIIHSDSETDIRILNQEAAKAMAAGRSIGLDISTNDALRWITANAAWALGVDDQVGSLEAGKMGDLVLWDEHPFSVYALPQKVFIEGHEVYDRRQGRRPSDFELGQPARQAGAVESRP